MRNLYTYIALASVLFSGFVNPSLAADKPLMVIRFANNPVGYEKRIDEAVKMALEKKPGVVFEVVAVYPDTEDKKLKRNIENSTKLIAKNVADIIENSGVPVERIQSKQTPDNSVTGLEVQIFVE